MNQHELNKTKLSILIPLYNVEKYIVECLDSILCQINNDCEVIVYDDASTDNSLLIVKSHPIAKIKNFTLAIGDCNKGLSFARNTLRSLSSGDYVWFMDSDDKLLKDSIEKVFSCLNSSNPDVLLFNFIAWYEPHLKHIFPVGDEKKTYDGTTGYHQTTPEKTFIALLNNGNLHAPAKIFNSKLFTKDTEFPVGRIFEDISVTPILASLSSTIYYIDEPLFAYRYRSGSIMRTMSLSQLIEPLKSTLDLRQRYENIHGPISIDVSNALTYFSSRQVRTAIKDAMKSPQKDDLPTVLNNILNTYYKIHSKNYIQIMKACIENGGLNFCYQLTRRLLQAKINSLKN